MIWCGNRWLQHLDVVDAPCLSPALRFCLNDHDVLRSDSVLALLVGKRDLTGEKRERGRDAECPLAGSSTLNRHEEWNYRRQHASARAADVPVSGPVTHYGAGRSSFHAYPKSLAAVGSADEFGNHLWDCRNDSHSIDTSTNRELKSCSLKR